MIQGLLSNPQGNVWTHHVKANVNNLSFGLSPSRGAPTFLADLTKAIDLHIEILSGVTVGSAAFPYNSTIQPALYFRLPAGSRVYINNRGTIWGGGGRGGEGDRGRENMTVSGFVGGGGGGGAGTNSVGGSEASADFDAGNTATNGSGAAGGSTTGGVAGVNSVSVSGGGPVIGAPPQIGGDAIQFAGTNAISIYIDNTTGLIYAGADGGEGGRQIAPTIPGGTLAPVNGSDTPNTMTINTTSIAPTVAVGYANGSTLTWIGGGVYPSVRGVVNKRP